MNILKKASLSVINHTSHQLNKSHKSFGRSTIPMRGWQRNYHNSSMIYQSYKNHSILKQLSILPLSHTTNSNYNKLITSTKTTTMATIANRNNKITNNNKNNNLNKNNLNNMSVFSTRNQSQKTKAGFRKDRQYGLCFLGAPGVGKGTYSKRIANHFNAKILASGDLIRECAKVNEGTVLGNQLQECINKGQLVPDDIVIPMVVAYLRMLPDSFILDGFPRTLTQAQRIHNEYRLHCVAYFKLPDHVLITKMLGRRICNGCGANFNIAHIEEGEIIMPSMAPKKEGICDNCGTELTMRPDDTEETIKERLRIYHEQTGPIEEFYKDAGLLLEYNIKKGIDDVPDILNKLEDFVSQYDEDIEREPLVIAKKKGKYYGISDDMSGRVKHQVTGFGHIPNITPAFA